MRDKDIDNCIKQYVEGEEPFRYIGFTGRFDLEASTDAYELQTSADMDVWTKRGDVPANEELTVTNAVMGQWFRLHGNTQKLRILMHN